jgi:hypothetical protein
MVDARPHWLDKPESERLEYKSADALAHRESIVRAVVSLLNHRGGHVVVGVNDDGRPEGKTDLLREPEKLQTALIDSIEPRPVDRVHVSCLRVQGAEVLEIKVRGGRHNRTAIYAERRNGLYGFWTRSGPTTRALTLAEVKERWKPANERPRPKRWDEPLALAKKAERDIVLVLQAELGEGDDLDRNALQRVLAPEKRGELNRRENGWTVVSTDDRVEPRKGRTIQAGEQGARKWLCCELNTRTIRFEGRSDFLRWQSPPAIEEPVIYPYPLVEGIASFFWLLQQYAREASPDGEVHCQLGIWRPHGWRIGPHRPGTIAWEWPTRWKPAHDDNVERAVDVSWAEIREAPDQVAYPFVVHVYEDFGYEASDVPFWVEERKCFVFEP